jgi:2-polyprenyl-6-hydroxyphenyl methylase/3-demethylubiquinone-9 3-methyltransferase
VARGASPVATGQRRFAFGRNWQSFLSVVNEERISAAEAALRCTLGVTSLEGKSFLDIGSGSGLSSLAAVRLGARRVHSFDYDPDSVACAEELRRRYQPDALHWSIEQGSALDERYMTSLGRWDVVYSWGVLHHTGHMWRGLELAARAVADGGRLLVAIYNDQGRTSALWRRVKRAYNHGRAARVVLVSSLVPYFFLGSLARDIVRRRSPLRRYRAHVRGMSPLHDWIDWIGGYPFEVASRDAVVAFYAARGFALRHLESCGTKSGCNEFVFERCGSSS